MEVTNTPKKYNSSDGLVFSCQYHVVFCPKYKRKIFTPPYDDALKQMFYSIAEEFGFSILDLEVAPEYIHMVIECNPRFGIVECVKKLKAKTAHDMREKFPELKTRLPTLWTRAAFISSAGTVSLDAVRQYIESQKGK